MILSRWRSNAPVPDRRGRDAALRPRPRRVCVPLRHLPSPPGDTHTLLRHPPPGLRPPSPPPGGGGGSAWRYPGISRARGWCWRRFPGRRGECEPGPGPSPGSPRALDRGGYCHGEWGPGRELAPLPGGRYPYVPLLHPLPDRLREEPEPRGSGGLIPSPFVRGDRAKKEV
jgi:hypothetical protein